MDAELLPRKREVIPHTAKEVMVGAAGGIAQVLIGQPFDIIKVRMQTQAARGALQMARNVWTREGSLAFYKGSTAPLVGVGACISMVFTSFQCFSSMLASQNNSDDTKRLLFQQIYLAGGMAGLVNSVMSGPVEHIRIRLQTQRSESSQQLYSGTRDCVQKILRQAGLAGLYRGQIPTMLREFHSYGIWFAAYEFLLGQMMARENQRREDIAPWKVAGCGGIAGEVLWAANHPFDVVKSKMQTDGFGPERNYRTMRDAVRQTWQVDGFQGFFRGLGPTLCRAMPVSAGTFVVVETVRRWIT